MSFGNTFENDLAKLIFQNTDAANIGDATGLRGSATAGSLYVALHTADPGEAGSQTTSEAAYGGYARQAVARSSGGWTVTNNQVVNAALIQFPIATSGSETEFFWSVGTSSSGAGKILAKGPLGTNKGYFVGENSNDQITCKGHGLSVDDRVVFFAGAQGTLPTGITEGTVYFVKTVPDGDTITISTTSGGSTVDITADGSGVLYKMTGQVAVSVNVQPQLAAGALAINLD